MSVTIAVKRGTRAQIDAAAGSNGLVVGELYLITDEQRLAVGLTTGTYTTVVTGSTRIFVGASTPSGAVDGDVWIHPA